MKVSLSLPVVEGPGPDPFRETFEIAQAAEANGFYGAFIGHHHFTPGYETAPWVVLAAVAARTTTLRLGTSIYLLPTHHPLDVAENVATLDRISGGRVILGAGIGYRPYEYDAFELPYAKRGARMTEALEILPAAWSGKPISHVGRQFEFHDVTVYPTPVQDPHPPIWVGAVARHAQERAAKLGDGWMSDIMEPLPREQRLAERYRGFCNDAGRPPTVCLMRTAAVAERRADLEDRWLPGVLQMQLSYWQAGAQGSDKDRVFARLEAGESVSLPEFARERLIAGTPDDCVEQIHQWQEAVRPDHLLLGLGGAEAGPAGLRRAIELFGREVLPHVTS